MFIQIFIISVWPFFARHGGMHMCKSSQIFKVTKWSDATTGLWQKQHSFFMPHYGFFHQWGVQLKVIPQIGTHINTHNAAKSTRWLELEQASRVWWGGGADTLYCPASFPSMPHLEDHDKLTLRIPCHIFFMVLWRNELYILRYMHAVQSVIWYWNEMDCCPI